MGFLSELIEWKNGGIEPPQDLIDGGFKAGYKPPAATFNWFWNRISAAVTENRTKIVELETDVETSGIGLAEHISDVVPHITAAERELWNTGGSGGGGGGDYTTITNKPQINNVTLNAGNNTLEALGIPSVTVIDGKANSSVDYSTTLLTTNWSTTAPYTMTLLGFTGLTANDKPFIGVALSADTQLAISQLASWGMVSKAQTSANSITFTCLESKPTVDIPIQIKVVY